MSVQEHEIKSGALRRAAEESGGRDVAAALRRLMRELLQLQCAASGGRAAIAVLDDSNVRKGGVVASIGFPEGSDLDGASVASLERALQADSSQDAGAHLAGRVSLNADASGMYGSEQDHAAAVVPLIVAGQREGSTAVALQPGLSEQELARSLAALTATADRFAAYLWEQRCLSESRQRTLLRETLELLDVAQQGGSSKAMGGLICHELARRFGCTRVSVGLVRGDRIRVEAISGAEDVDGRGELSGLLEHAMEEAAAQDAEVVYPVPPEAEDDPAMQRVTRAAEKLSDRFGPSAVLSMPLRVEGDLVGAMVLERDRSDPFPVGALGLLRLVAEYTGPAMWTRRLADRGIAAVVRDRVLDLTAAAVGPRHTAVKLVALLLLAVFVGLAVVPVPDRISADTTVQAETSRTVVPPYAGYLASVEVEPGDEVAAGDILAKMDTSELELTLAEASGRRANLVTERDDALSKRERAKARQLSAQIGELDAQADLIRDQIRRASITAPISGVIGRGDLDEFVNARVDPTMPLFEMVTAERVLVIEVDERSVGGVEVGDTGRFASVAEPAKKAGFVVVRVNPVAQAATGKNVFLVEAELTGDTSAAWLRPGMTGVAKIDDGWTTGLSALAGPLVERLRMWLWL